MIQKKIYAHQDWFAITAGILLGGGSLSALMHSPLTDIAVAGAAVIAFIPIVTKAITALRAHAINVELLVAIATIGALAIGEFVEAAAVTFLFLIGSLLERRTLRHTRAAIKTLTTLTPTSATRVLANGDYTRVPIADVEVGTTLIVRTGDTIPVDGHVTAGSASVNASALTGEATPSPVAVGSHVAAGTHLTDGAIQVVADQVGDDTTFARIIELVEEAQDSKSAVEKFINHFARYYTPAVLALAGVILLVTRDLRTAITVLVLGCPGALVIGAPVSTVAGIGNGARRGILIKGGETLSTLAAVDTFVFDKTGTLTTGVMHVTAFRAFTPDAGRVLQLAATVAAQATHPLSVALSNYAAAHQAPPVAPVSDLQIYAGRGLSGTVDRHHVVVGNPLLLTELKVVVSPTQRQAIKQLRADATSVVLIAIDHKLAGMVGITDSVRADAGQTIARLRAAGAQKIVILTGDNTTAAARVATALNVDAVHANLLPAAKVDYIQQFRKDGHKVAFIGDGINDGPAIATADIGIAIGSGTDVAIETSDVVLMSDQLPALVHAYALAKKTRANITENITLAIAVVAFLLLGLALGFVHMASGMLVHEVSILLVTINALHLVRFGNHTANKIS